MTSDSTVKKWGNSLALRLPSSVIKDLGLSENSIVEIVSDGKVATIKPAVQQVNIGQLVAAITSENMHQQVDLNEPVGNEVW